MAKVNITAAPALLSIDTLIAYVEQYRPGFRAAIRGASEEEVAELEALVGRPLPPAYRQFLRRMGHGTADLPLRGPDDSTDIADMIEYYRGVRMYPEDGPPHGCLRILETDIDGTEVYLDTRHAPEPPVVTRGSGGMLYHSASLLTWLYGIAFRAFRQPAMVHQRYTSSSADAGGRDVLPEAVALAEAAGFRRQWFSDRRDFCGERPEQAAGEGLGKSEAALCLSQDDYKTSYGTLVFSVAAATAVEAEHLAAPFLARFGPGR